jgi:hypothetical protein
MPHYGVNDGELLVFDDPPTWHGRIEGRPVRQAASLSETPDAIVLLEPPLIEDSRQPFPNLLRVGPDGQVVWRAELPEPGDWTDEYVEFGHRDGKLTANSWSCFHVVLDPETGRILSKKFTK